MEMSSGQLLSALSITSTSRSKLENDSSLKFTWRIENFSEQQCNPLFSQVFSFGGHKWRLLIFPKGRKDLKYFYVVLKIAGAAVLPHGWTTEVKCSLSLISQVSEYTTRKEIKHQFKAGQEGWFFPAARLSDVHDPCKGYLVNDTCIVEVVLDKEIIDGVKRQRGDFASEEDENNGENARGSSSEKSETVGNDQTHTEAEGVINSLGKVDDTTTIIDYIDALGAEVGNKYSTKSAEVKNAIDKLIGISGKGFGEITQNKHLASALKDLIGYLLRLPPNAELPSVSKRILLEMKEEFESSSEKFQVAEETIKACKVKIETKKIMEADILKCQGEIKSSICGQREELKKLGELKASKVQYEKKLEYLKARYEKKMENVNREISKCEEALRSRSEVMTTAIKETKRLGEDYKRARSDLSDMKEEAKFGRKVVNETEKRWLEHVVAFQWFMTHDDKESGLKGTG